jgi:O-antigen/teichoic acid export membrane protein
MTVQERTEAANFRPPSISAVAATPGRLKANSALRLLREGIWITAAQATAGIATLIGVRFITELAPAALYGTFVLMNGGLSFLQGILFAPMAQAALRFYPDYVIASSDSRLRRELVRVFLTRSAKTLALLVLACVVDVVWLHWLSPLAWALVGVGVFVEAWKAIEVVMRNAAGQQRTYSFLIAADAVARPLGAVCAAFAIGASVESLLLGQLLGAFFVLGGLSRFSAPLRREPVATLPNSDRASQLGAEMNRFAAPLVWAPMLGWLTGLADRYVVGGMLGVAQAGVYAAAYGLASRPLLMIGGVTDATLRQMLYGAVASRNGERLGGTVKIWIGANLVAALVGAIVLTVFAHPLVAWLLAHEYRSTSALLLPWIAFGYALMLVTQPVERLLYAANKTRTVIALQSIGALTAIICAFVGAQWKGVFGVAVTVPIYMAVQLLITIWAARRIKVISP